MSEAENLDENVIYEVLSNERRRLAIEYLREGNGSVDVNELAEHIAEHETGESPPPKDARKTVYVSLHQTHLPKLDELDIAEYDKDDKTVTLSDSFRDVAIYMEVVPNTGFRLSWSEYYLAVALVGIATMFAHLSGVTAITALDAEYWGLLFFAVVAVSALYQTVTRRSL